MNHWNFIIRELAIFTGSFIGACAGANVGLRLGQKRLEKCYDLMRAMRNEPRDRWDITTHERD